MYHLCGIISILLLILGLSFVLMRWPRGIQYTFSQHIAQYRIARIFYVLLFAIVLLLLQLFFFGWFIPHFRTPILFGLLITVGSLTQLACTFIPEIGGWKANVHRFLAGISAITLFPALIVLVVQPGIPLKPIFYLSIVSMSAIMLAATAKITNKNLYLQISYYVAFFVPILIISYL